MTGERKEADFVGKFEVGSSSERSLSGLSFGVRGGSSRCRTSHVGRGAEVLRKDKLTLTIVDDIDNRRLRLTLCEMQQSADGPKRH